MQGNFSYHKILLKISNNCVGLFFWHSSCERKRELFHKREVVIMKMVSMKAVSAIFIAGVLIVPFSKQVFSQNVPEQQTNVNDEQLKSFAKVYVQVEKIRQTYEPRVKQAPGPDEGKQIQQEAQSKFQDVLTKEGLSEENYTQIIEMARADDSLRKKVLQMIVEERNKS